MTKNNESFTRGQLIVPVESNVKRLATVTRSHNLKLVKYTNYWPQLNRLVSQ